MVKTARKISFFLTVLGVSRAFAALPGISYYRSPQSLFPSGQVSFQTLAKKTVGNEFLFHYLVEREHRSQWVAAEYVARDLELSAKVTYQKQDYFLRDIRGYWALIESTKDARRDWAPMIELKPSVHDFGMALTLIPTAMRAGPSWSSDLIMTLPARTRLAIEKIEDSWIQVRFDGSQLGYVDLNNVLLKADFANFVMDKSGEWQKVLYRESFMMMLENKKSIALSEIKAWRTQRDLAVVVRSDESKNLLLRQTAKILKTEAQIWGISELKDHGNVFWRRNDISEIALMDALTLRKEDLLKREVFSVSWDTHNPKVGLVASHGIFATEDAGETWRFLPIFKNENHPVSISPDGSWFVGFQKSKDHGKSFGSYLRTDFLTKLIESQSAKAPRTLKLSNIEFKDSKMKIRIDTGIRQIWLATKSQADNITDWDFVN